jgi:hypothetical protein
MKYIKLLENNELDFNNFDDVDDTGEDQNFAYYINVYDKDPRSIFLCEVTVDYNKYKVFIKFYRNYSRLKNRYSLENTEYNKDLFIDDNGNFKDVVYTLYDGDSDCYFLIKTGHGLTQYDIKEKLESLDKFIRVCDFDVNFERVFKFNVDKKFLEQQ